MYICVCAYIFHFENIECTLKTTALYAELRVNKYHQGKGKQIKARAGEKEILGKVKFQVFWSGYFENYKRLTAVG